MGERLLARLYPQPFTSLGSATSRPSGESVPRSCCQDLTGQASALLVLTWQRQPQGCGFLRVKWVPGTSWTVPDVSDLGMRAITRLLQVAPALLSLTQSCDRGATRWTCKPREDEAGRPGLHLVLRLGRGWEVGCPPLRVDPVPVSEAGAVPGAVSSTSDAGTRVRWTSSVPCPPQSCCLRRARLCPSLPSPSPPRTPAQSPPTPVLHTLCILPRLARPAGSSGCTSE